MTSEEYIKLYQKYIEGKCSADEVQKLFDYKDNFRLLETAETVEDEALKAKIRNRITTKIEPAKYIINKTWYKYAAAAIIIITVGVTLVLKKWDKEISVEKSKIIAHTHEPSFKRTDSTTAVLTLADGSIIPLDETENGLLTKEAGTDIVKVQSGELSYNTSGQLIGDGNSINKIAIPRGATYKITLADGTKVWLNAASSLSYPSRFNGSERKVELVGEAYFEVAKNEKMPFKVKMKDTEVEVLGTHFNISAYENDHHIKTTLLEGSVRLSHLGTEKILKPGNQGITTENSSAILLKQVNAPQVLAWKNGYFLFKESTIEEVMNQIARWYKVQVVYDSKIEGKLFGGIYARSKKLEELLKGLELTGLVKFKIEEGISMEERRVIVMD